MRICFVTNGVISSHATMKRAFGMARPLLGAGHSVAVLLEDHPDNRERVAAVPGVEAHWIPLGLGLRAHLRAKRTVLGQGAFDVVHCCGLGFRNLVWRGDAPGALRIMDHVELESSLAGHPLLRRWVLRALEARVLAGYSAHVAASRYLHAVLHQRCRGARRLLYLPYASEAPALPARPAGTEGRRVALYMGGLYREYGVWDILDAAERLLASEPLLDFEILGQGPESERLAAWVSSRNLEGRIRLAGYVPEAQLHARLASADLFLAPLADTVSDWARCPSKLLTYMSYGRPVVTGPVGEATVYLGSRGFYYSGGSAGLAEAVSRALRAPRGLAPYDFPLSWEERVAAYLQWLEAAAA